MYMHICLVLSGQGYFAQPEFLRYLSYLMYWTEPEYAKHILFANCFCVFCVSLLKFSSFCRFPMSLSILRSLQEEEFRQLISEPRFIQELKSQMMIQWQFKHKT